MSGELRPVARVIVGDVDQVAAAIRAAERRGTLVSARRPVPLGHRRVRADVVLLEPAHAALESGRRRRVRVPWPVVVVAGTVLALLAGLFVLAALVTTWVAAHAGQILGVAVGVALALTLLSRSGVACRGIHCPGCPHR